MKYKCFFEKSGCGPWEKHDFSGDFGGVKLLAPLALQWQAFPGFQVAFSVFRFFRVWRLQGLLKPQMLLTPPRMFEYKYTSVGPVAIQRQRYVDHVLSGSCWHVAITRAISPKGVLIVVTEGLIDGLVD